LAESDEFVCIGVNWSQATPERPFSAKPAVHCHLTNGNLWPVISLAGLMNNLYSGCVGR